MPGQTISGGERTWLVRKAVPEDAPKVNIYFENLKAEDLPWFSGFTESAEACSEFIERSLQAPDRSLVLVAEVGTDVVGFLNCRRLDFMCPSASDLQHVSVRSTYRNRGLGDALMTSLLEWASSGGLRELTAVVHAKNEGAQRFLCRFKFKEETLPGGSPEYRHFVLELSGPEAEEAV